MNNKIEIIGYSILSFIITIILGIIFIFIMNGYNEGTVWGVILMPISGLFNLVFLLLVYFSGLSRSILLSKRLILLEVILFILTYAGVSEILDKISSHNIIFKTEHLDSIGSVTSVITKFYLEFPFDFIYTFIILSILIFVFRKIKNYKESKNNSQSIGY